MFTKFHKSRAVTIFRSLATSPAAMYLYWISISLILIVIFYGVYLFNLYLSNEGIIHKPVHMTHEGNAFISIIFELMSLCGIVCLFFFFYFIINDIIKCISDTKEKLVQDINEYECNAISWQK